MKLALTTALVVGAFAALFAATQAIGADPTAAKIAALQKQVKKLQATDKRLQAQILGLNDQLELNFEGDTCLGAQTADLVQGTWTVIDQIAQGLQSKTYFGSQTQVDDYRNCDDLAQPDVPRPGIVVPPKIDPFRPLLQWLHEPLP